MKTSYNADLIEVGCDEAGRGCLAGPVFAAAVIFDKNFDNQNINDSKLMSAKNRQIQKEIIQESALAWAVARVDPAEIDEMNILNASILAMHLALDQLQLRPQHIIVDGNRFKPYQQIPHLCIVKGDSKYLNIAAASILAKTYRDEYMENLHEEFPMYDWKKNKGYPTKFHRNAIAQYGVTSHHRKTFKLLPTQLELDL